MASEEQRPTEEPGKSSVLESTGKSVLADGAQTARGTEPRYGRSAYSGGEDPGDRHEKLRAEAEARFFDSPYEADHVSALRRTALRSSAER